MKKGWTTKRIGDLCDIATGGTPSRSKPEYFGGNIKWLVSGDIHQGEIHDCEGRITEAGMKNSNAKLLPPNSVMIALNGQGKTRATVALLRTSATCNQSLVCMTPKPSAGLLPEFLYANLHGRYEEIRRLTSDDDKDRRGLNMGIVRGIEVPVPPLAEQQRIVGVLDEAFAGIAIAQANAEKNLQNARALFESYLQSVFTKHGKGWVEHKLGDVCEFVGGSQPPKSVFSKIKSTDSIRLIQIRDYKSDKHIVYIPRAKARRFCTANDVMIGRYGPPLFQILRGLNGAYNVALMKAVPDESKLSRDFLFYFLKHSAILEYVIYHSNRAAGQIGVTKETLEPYPIALPSLTEQKKVVANIDALVAETQRLARLYERKLAALEALKKSLLHLAFAGELTGQSRRSVVIPFPTKIPNVTTTDLHAGILAIAFQLHEKNGKQKYYGHVKAEKIAHMIETHVGIDLERDSIKDAAGPNDYTRFKKKVEPRAKKAGYFEFKGSEKTGYKLHKLGQFDSLIAKTRAALGERNQAVDDLLSLMLPMDTQQAEIFSTVYAAWNNLLIDKESITDEAIVLAARENWHPDKLKIPREKFFAAITWIKEKGICPEGKGKKVLNKAVKKRR